LPERQLAWKFEPLDVSKHDRAAFDCGNESLTTYLQQYANQDLKKKIAAVMVLTPDGRSIAGYYTLSQYSVGAGELPPELKKKLKLPKYDKLPATLLGRLARSIAFRASGLGELLLMHALKSSLAQSRHIASTAVLVDAIDENAKTFYVGYGFIELPDNPSRLSLPIATIEQMF
jgi:predicted GNAT family N-acyltransferase